MSTWKLYRLTPGTKLQEAAVVFVISLVNLHRYPVILYILFLENLFLCGLSNATDQNRLATETINLSIRLSPPPPPLSPPPAPKKA